MTKFMTVARRFRKEEDGAAMVEYSILIGIIAAASIATIALIGTWVAHQFTQLCADMGTNGASGSNCTGATA